MKSIFLRHPAMDSIPISIIKSNYLLLWHFQNNLSILRVNYGKQLSQKLSSVERQLGLLVIWLFLLEISNFAKHCSVDHLSNLTFYLFTPISVSYQSWIFAFSHKERKHQNFPFFLIRRPYPQPPLGDNGACLLYLCVWSIMPH